MNNFSHSIQGNRPKSDAEMAAFWQEYRKNLFSGRAYAAHSEAIDLNLCKPISDFFSSDCGSLNIHKPLQIHIFSYLDKKTLLICRNVCRTIYSICNRVLSKKEWFNLENETISLQFQKFENDINENLKNIPSLLLAHNEITTKKNESETILALNHLISFSSHTLAFKTHCIFLRNLDDKNPQLDEVTTLTLKLEIYAKKCRDEFLRRLERLKVEREKTKDLFLAIVMGNVLKVANLIKNGINVNVCNKFTGCFPFHIAVKKQRLDILKLIVPLTTDLNSTFGRNGFNQKTAISLAIDNADQKIANYLIEKGADVNTPITALIRNTNPSHSIAFPFIRETQPPLFWAILSCNWRKIEFLTDKTSHLPELYAYTFNFAIKMGLSNVLQYLLTKNVDVDRLDEWGVIPLHQAVKNKNLDVVKLLTPLTKCINSPDISGSTALIHACEVGSTKIAKYLIENGADANRIGSRSQSALHKSVSIGKLKLVKLLIQYTKQEVINNIESDLTPLQEAFILKRGEIVTFLLNNGADPTIPLRKGYGEYALGYSQLAGHG